MDLLRRRLAIGIVIVALAVATASPVLRNELTQDDVPLVREDARIHDLGNIREMVTTPFWPKGGVIGHHRPLMTVTLALEWAMGRGAVISFKVMSLALHAATALAVFLLCLELLPLWWAATAALAFAVHPVHVEAVAIAMNQGELLIALAYCLVVRWYLQFRRARIPTWRDRLTLGVIIFTATLYKETGVVLPALLGAAELFLLPGEGWRERLRHFRPTVLVQVAAVLAVVWIRAQVLGDVRGTFTAEGLIGQQMGGRALTMLGVVPEYLRLLFWPASLQADYSPGEIVPATAWGAAQTLGLLILALVGVLVARLWRSAPVVVFGLAWIAIGIAPVHNVVIPAGIVLAERTLFLPSVGAVIVVAALLAGLAESPAWRRRRAVQWATAALLTLVVGLGAARSWSRYHVWRSQIGLWTQTVIDAPDSYRAWVALGSLMIRPEHFEMGVRFTQRGIDLYPNPAVMIGLGQSLQNHGACNRAIPVYQRALAINEFAPGRSEYLSCLTWEGEYDLAYREAMTGIRSGYYYKVFRSWRRHLETLRRERPPRHSHFAPPGIGDLLTTEKEEPGVWQLQPAMRPEPAE